MIRSYGEFLNELAKVVQQWKAAMITHESAMERVAALLKEQGR